MNALQLFRRQFSHKETLQQTFFKRSAILDGNRPFCIFSGHVAYDDHLKLIGERSGLNISVNWSFFARCFGWVATSEYWLKIGDFAPTGAGWPKISARRAHPHQPFSSQKTRLNDLSYGIKNLDRSLFHFVTMQSFDRQTDRRTDRILFARLPLHCIQRGKNRLIYIPYDNHMCESFFMRNKKSENELSSAIEYHPENDYTHIFYSAW